MNILIPVIVLILLCVGYGFLLKHLALKGLTVERHFSSPAVYAGETGEMVEVVCNDRPLPVPWLRVESRIPAGIRLGRQANMTVSGNLYYQSMFMLLPFQRITRHHHVRFVKRGRYDLGNAALTAGDLLGFAVCGREQQMSVPLTVYPALPDEKDLPEPLTFLTGEWARQRQLLTDPFLYRGIREYRPGDPVRDIHWPASARTGETMVRVHDPSARLKLLVVINSQLRADQWENLMDYEQGTIENEISLAAGLCVTALRNGLEAGFAANMPEDGDKGTVIRLPEAGPGREEELLSAFAGLRILRTLSFTEFLRTIDVPEGTDVVILTSYTNEADDRQAERLRAEGCRVTVCVVPKAGEVS